MRKPTPRHDWTSHAADAFRYLAMGWQEQVKEPEEEEPERVSSWMAA